jgi:hypothetical protein
MKRDTCTNIKEIYTIYLENNIKEIYTCCIYIRKSKQRNIYYLFRKLGTVKEY